MIQIFIGYDSSETVAYHVLAHSIMRRSSVPVSITPIGNSLLPDHLWWRGRGVHDSTEFSNARFLVPSLADRSDIFMFMDCDMVCLGDIAELVDEARSLSDPWTVMVKKHDYTPENKTKFLGQENAAYSRKNWSSLMVFNPQSLALDNLSVPYVNDAPGLHLHQFAWCPDSQIAPIAGTWNMLVGVNAASGAKLLHYTNGGPWHGYTGQHDIAWQNEFRHLLGESNPNADISSSLSDNAASVEVTYQR